MSTVLNKLKRWAGQTQKNAEGQPIHWRYGTVISSSPRMIWADTATLSIGKVVVAEVHQRYISLQGDSYVYVCQACSQSITQLQVDEAQKLPNRAEERCPMCQAQKSLRYVKKGERMKFHYRWDDQGGGWYGEVIL